MKSLATTAGEKEISAQIFCIRRKNIAVSTAGLLGERPRGHHGWMGWGCCATWRWWGFAPLREVPASLAREEGGCTSETRHLS